MRRWRREFAQAGRKQQAEDALQTLAALQKADVSPRRGFWALRLIHLQVRPILDEFHQMLRGQSLPLPWKTQAMLQCYLAILEGMAHCYLRIADQEVFHRKPSRKRAARALHASLELRGEALLACTKVYTTPPSGFWTAVNGVYRSAERAGMAAMRIKPVAPDGGSRPQTVASAYRKILAFAVAQTENLRRSQLTPAFKALAGWVASDHIAREPVSQNPHQPLVWVDINSDQPPELKVPEPKVPEHATRRMGGLSEGERFMKLTGIVAELEALESTEEVEESVLNHSDVLCPATVDHLLGRFSTTHVRRSERKFTTAPVDVRPGLDEIQSSLSYVVADGKQHDTQVATAAIEQSEPARLSLLQTVEHSPDTPNLHLSSQPNDNLDDSRVPVTSVGVSSPPNRDSVATPTGTPSATETPDWTLLDESAEGLRLKWNANRPSSHVGVGQLIAYRTLGNTEDATAWRLATVRWIRFEDSHVFQLGAEKISGDPYPAVVRSLPKNVNRKRKHRQEYANSALLVHRGDTDKSTLITPSYLYTKGEVVERLDRPAMQPLPAQAYVYAEWKYVKPGIDYHVDIDRRLYSVPHTLVGLRLEARLTATTVEIFHKGQRVAAHTRHGTGAHSTLAEHMPAAHRKHQQWTPGRFLNWAQAIGPATRAVIHAQLEGRPHPEHGYRACLGLLNLARHYGNARLEAACARAAYIGSPGYRSIKSILKSGLDRAGVDMPPETRELPLHANVRGPDYYH